MIFLLCVKSLYSLWNRTLEILAKNDLLLCDKNYFRIKHHLSFSVCLYVCVNKIHLVLFWDRTESVWPWVLHVVVTLNFWSSCLHLLSTRVTSTNYRAWFMQSWGQDQGFVQAGQIFYPQSSSPAYNREFVNLDFSNTKLILWFSFAVSSLLHYLPSA